MAASWRSVISARCVPSFPVVCPLPQLYIMSSAVTRFVAPFLRRSRASMLPRANISSKPAKGNVSGVETVIGISAFVLAFLIPSGWVLSNMEAYKKRD
ncbi:hypothetical protein NDU88_005970 [Pleurodeles waltl]|uniref:Uncharacterized protein n=1 Tax=Pleurodeles waltl TaxID=8319 RepID=A0AAV7MZY7_PLEWA|nr:hypothetical protein NDU88_005970 [Pleurodeles waltl]